MKKLFTTLLMGTILATSILCGCSANPKLISANGINASSSIAPLAEAKVDAPVRNDAVTAKPDAEQRARALILALPKNVAPKSIELSASTKQVAEQPKINDLLSAAPKNIKQLRDVGVFIQTLYIANPKEAVSNKNVDGANVKTIASLEDVWFDNDNYARGRFTLRDSSTGLVVEEKEDHIYRGIVYGVQAVVQEDFNVKSWMQLHFKEAKPRATGYTVPAGELVTIYWSRESAPGKDNGNEKCIPLF